MIDFFTLRESFNRPYKFTKRTLYKGYIVYRFVPDDKTEVDVMFKEDEISDDESVWNVSFERNMRQDMTGEGDAMRIFATVINVIRDFSKSEKPQELAFSAVKPDWFEIELGDKPNVKSSREKLYKRMVKRFAPSMGFNFKVDARRGATDYRLVKK